MNTKLPLPRQIMFVVTEPFVDSLKVLMPERMNLVLRVWLPARKTSVVFAPSLSPMLPAKLDILLQRQESESVVGH